MTAPRIVGVVGIHGFSRVHLEQLMAVRSAAAIDGLWAVAHRPDLDPAYVARLQQAGVGLVGSLEDLLKVQDLGLVTLPVGIQLHVPMTEAILAKGVPVYLEKPVAGCLADFDRIAAHPRADLVQVGFQHLALPGLRDLRARLAAGAFGPVRRIVVTCGWPRGDAYYQRNGWAGQLMADGVVINDSPANNACAHHLNIALFLASSRISRVDAFLGRGNPIPSFDTCGIRIGLEDGAEIVFNASHLGVVDQGIRLRVECARATITCDELNTGRGWRSEAPGPLPTEADPQTVTFGVAVNHVFAGGPPVCTVEEARPHAQVIQAIHSQPIHDLPGRRRGADRWCLPGIEAVLDARHRDGRALSAADLDLGGGTFSRASGDS